MFKFLFVALALTSNAQANGGRLRALPDAPASFEAPPYYRADDYARRALEILENAPAHADLILYPHVRAYLRQMSALIRAQLEARTLTLAACDGDYARADTSVCARSAQFGLDGGAHSLMWNVSYAILGDDCQATVLSNAGMICGVGTRGFQDPTFQDCITRTATPR